MWYSQTINSRPNTILRLNKLTLNYDETAYITFGPGKTSLQAFGLKMNNQFLKKRTVVNLVGTCMLSICAKKSFKKQEFFTNSKLLEYKIAYMSTL